VIRRNQEDKPAIVDSLAIDVRKRIIDRLHEALADSSFRARNWVVPAIVDMDRTKLREAMPVFVTLIRRQDAYGVSQESIARRGPDAARIIIDYLDDPNPNVRQELASLLARCHGKIVPVLASGLRHPNPAIRAGVLNALSMNPAHGRSLRSAIINRLNDDDPQVQFAAATTLVTLDPKKADAAVPVFVDASFSRDALHRLRGIAWLQTMGPEARGAVPALFRHVNSTDVATRLAAAQALAAIDKSTWRSFVPALMDTIASGEVYQRTSAATLLGRTGPNARASLPALRAMLSDEHHPNRLVSAEAMIQIDPDDIDDSIETFANALKVDSDNNRSLRTVRRQAITAISRIGAPAKPTVPALLDVMRNESNEHVAMLAASTAIKLDPDKCDEAYDRFRLHLQPTHPDPDDIWLDGIVQLGKAAKPLLPNLIEAINGKATYQRYAVLEALTMLGPDAKEALPALKDLAKTKKGPSGVDDAIKAIEGKK
jgi:HEAT repeat protein